MKAIPEEEKTNATVGATVPTTIATSKKPLAKPAAVQFRSSSQPGMASIRLSTASAHSAPGSRMSLAGLDPIAVQKSLTSELQHWKEMYTKQQKDMQKRIDTLEQENEDLLQEQDMLNDRHQSHTEELRYMQNEFLCIKGHLQKLRNDMESLDKNLNEQQKKQNQQKMTREEHQLAEKVEESIFKVKERQEFTCVFMDNTIASIDEILNEYIPEKPEYQVVEDHKTIEEVLEETKLRQMREEEELRKRRELEKQLLEQLKEEQLQREREQQLEVQENDHRESGSEFTSTSSEMGTADFNMSLTTLQMSSSMGMNASMAQLNSSMAMVQFDEHFSELGIETPAMKEARFFQETQTLFKEQQEMFARYIQECRSDEATTSASTRFKGWFDEKREKWLEQESMKEIRRKKRQSMAVMMHKVKQMHSDAVQKVTETKLQHFEEGEKEKDRKSQRKLKLGDIDEHESFKNPSPAPAPAPARKPPTEEEVNSKLEEEMRFSLTKGDLNDFFKQYKDSKMDIMGGASAAPSSRKMQTQESRGFLGLFGFGQSQKEEEMSC